MRATLQGYNGNLFSYLQTDCANASVEQITGGQQIDRTALTYTATATNRIYGAANPAFTGIITGFVLSENQASATTGTLVFNAIATTGHAGPIILPPNTFMEVFSQRGPPVT